MQKATEKKNTKKTDFFFELLDFEGKKIVFEINQLALKSNKSVVCFYGETVVLTTLTVKKAELLHNFLPLTVFYEERAFATGRIPNVFNRREGKGSNHAIQMARLIDRSLRTFFSGKDFQEEIQITNTVLAVDKECDPFLAASWSSFLVSYLFFPSFTNFFATVVLRKKENSDQLIIAPNHHSLLESSMSIVVSASEEKITMFELIASEISEEELEKALKFSLEKINLLISFFKEIVSQLEVEKEKKENHQIKITAEEKKKDSLLTEQIMSCLREKLSFLISSELSSFSWWEKEKKIKQVCEETIEIFLRFATKSKVEIVFLVDQISKVVFLEYTELVWKEKKLRLDGRAADEIREINLKIDYLPRVHGSALFSRGNTQVLSVVTIGKLSEKQTVDSFLFFVPSQKNFFHHYNFPSFATNEIAFRSSLSRREIGHGELVEKTFFYLLPSSNNFPYTIRVVSEVLSADGSSSQASVCAASLALFSAGIPLLQAAAGVSLGLFDDSIWTDINALEDQVSEFDLKVAGTEKGICSVQMDVKKSSGISLFKLQEAFQKAKKARLFILNKINSEVSSFKKKGLNFLANWKKIYLGEKIGLVIGAGGRVINELMKKSGVVIETQADGHVIIYHSSEEKVKSVADEIYKIIEKKRY